MANTAAEIVTFTTQVLAKIPAAVLQQNQDFLAKFIARTVDDEGVGDVDEMVESCLGMIDTPAEFFDVGTWAQAQTLVNGKYVFVA